LKRILFIVIALIAIGIFMVFFNGKGGDGGGDLSPNINFSEGVTFNEVEETMDDMLASLDNILFVDMKRDEERTWYFLNRGSIMLGEPSFHLTVDHLIDKNSEATYTLDVTSVDSIVEGKIEEAEEEFTTSDGTTVYLAEDANFKHAYFQSEGFYYTVNAQLPDDSTLSWETFKDNIENMSTDNPLADSVKDELTKKSEENFIMPGYFTNDMDLNDVKIENTGIEVEYRGTFEVSGAKSEITSIITYGVSDESYRYDEEESKEVDLSNGKGDLILAYDYPVESSSSYHQNVLFFEKDNLYFKVHTTNIENPINNTETEQLLKIANSIHQ